MKKPLEGIRVLDLTHMLSGPYGTMLLADLGADMIKVEPITGERTRSLLATDPNNSLKGMGAYFITLNRNKRSTTIDLKSEAGLSLFYELVKKADVVVNNFGAGVPEKLKISYDYLKQINPRIITCSITGYGSTGPGHKRPAFDQVTQATGGGMSITGKNAQEPTRAGIPIGDLGGGVFSVVGILSALLERERSGEGQDIDISMLDCQISLLNYMATMHFLSGEDPVPLGNSHFVHVPYNSYATADGHIVISVITDNFWHNLKTVVNCADFDKPEYDKQPGRLAAKDFIDATLAEIFATDTTESWLQQLNDKRIPCAPVNKFSQALQDETIRYRNMVVPLHHPEGGHTYGPGNPIKLSRSSEESFSPAPLTGQHNDEVFTELLGLSKDEMESLRKQGVIA